MVSLSLWTFKGTIWHPELAIDERQLTPLWHLRAAGGQAHVGDGGGPSRAPPRREQGGPSARRAARHHLPSPPALHGTRGWLPSFLINYSHRFLGPEPTGSQLWCKSD